MQARPDEGFAPALFRLLAAGCGIEAAGIFGGAPSHPRLLAGTAALQALRKPAFAGRWPPAAALRAPGGGVTRIDPAALGLDAAFAAIAGAGSDGFLLIADRRPRRLVPALAALLADAAALAAPLVDRAAAASEPRPPGDAAAGRAALRAAVLPRAAAQRLVEAALRGRRAGGPAALLILDLDRFRAVNEALGVAAGDALLAVTGARLEQALDSGDQLIRVDGDRFVVVARRAADELPALARRLLQTVSQPLVLDGSTLVMQASIGVVAASAAEVSTPVLLMQADTALRRAKAEGRNRFVLHEPGQDTAALEKSRLELDLAHAVANGQMHLVYQPYVDLRDGTVSGVEALLRWHHPTRGALQPAAFIPLAEATGLILPLGRWALRTALAGASRWPAALGLSVNISPLQFHQPGFLAEVDAALAESGFPPGRLELEITETVLMRDNPDTLAQLHALIARGVRIALDDFGTGYSALAYLARLPHHRIKLDKTFVQDLANPATADLIRAIIALARAQGVAITAEGVERPEHLALVRRAGFTHAQGYITGAPVADPTALLGEPAPAPVD